MKQKVLVIGDLHGRHELATKAYDTFLKGKYDKAIFLGDYADSHDRPDADILRTFNIVLTMKKNHPEQVELLVGNHDEPYFHLDVPRQLLSKGFRMTLHRSLSHVLAPNIKEFSYAYGIKNYLFTHAGVSHKWFFKHFDLLSMWATRMDMDLLDVEDLHIILDNIRLTGDKYILFEIGPERGGYDSDAGGPMWCDRDELLNFGPLQGLNQVVGHTSQQFISRIHTFEGNKKYKDTSVTFTDCLSHREQFLTLEI